MVEGIVVWWKELWCGGKVERLYGNGGSCGERL